ncbi:MAG: hypothetical protein V1924_09060 [Candidatus Bathyarchaeota archaeon]
MAFSLDEITIIIISVVAVIWIVSSSVKVVKEYERAIIFRLGRLIGAGRL